MITKDCIVDEASRRIKIITIFSGRSEEKKETGICICMTCQVNSTVYTDKYAGRGWNGLNWPRTWSIGEHL